MSSERPTGDVRCVVVDDAPLIRRMFRQAAELATGVTIVGEAADGADAVDVCRQQRPAAVVLDVDMPVMDGLESLGHIRAAVPGVKIAMFSGDNMARAASLAGGADAYFLKADTSPVTILEHLATLCAMDAHPRQRMG